MQPTSSAHLSSNVANTTIASALALTLGAVYLKAIEESSASPKTSVRRNSPTVEMREAPAEENMLGSIEQLPDDLKDRIFSHLLPLLPIYKVITLRNLAIQTPVNRWAKTTIDTFFNEVLALPHQGRPTLKQFQDFLRLEQQIKAHREKINTLINTLKTERGEPSRQWNFYLGVVPYTKNVHPTLTVKAGFIPDSSTGTLNLEHKLKCNILKLNEANEQAARTAQEAPPIPISIQSLQVLMQEPSWQPLSTGISQTAPRYLVGYDTEKLDSRAEEIQPEVEISDYIHLLEQHLVDFERMPFMMHGSASQSNFEFNNQSLSEMMHS